MSDFKLPPNPIITGAPQGQPVRKPAAQPAGDKSFREMLGQAVDNLTEKRITLSKHASQRVKQRGVPLTDADLERMGKAVDMAGGKGVTDTLVFMNNTAFIVNVPSKVVVTVVDGSETQENVFTNINGAVIL